MMDRGRIGRCACHALSNINFNHQRNFRFWFISFSTMTKKRTIPQSQCSQGHQWFLYKLLYVCKLNMDKYIICYLLLFKFVWLVRLVHNKCFISISIFLSLTVVPHVRCFCHLSIFASFSFFSSIYASYGSLNFVWVLFLYKLLLSMTISLVRKNE